MPTTLQNEGVFDSSIRKTINDNFAAPVSSAAPAAANAAGIPGAIAYDADYLYVCVATNTWKRVAISTWP